jgi:glycosyltransferase involved in cell wall biosynthesis
VGNLNKAKAVEVLLEAFHIVLKSQNNVKTIVSGKPIETQLGYWEFLQKRMSDLGLAGKAIFTGRYPNIRPLLAASTVFVMPSHAEGTPLAILEAMSMGIPVVATDVGGVAELVENGRTGILVPPGDPEAMATAICSLIGNPLLRESMGLESRKVAQTRFSKERCAERHLEVYRNTSNR